MFLKSLRRALTAFFLSCYDALTRCLLRSYPITFWPLYKCIKIADRPIPDPNSEIVYSLEMYLCIVVRMWLGMSVIGTESTHQSNSRRRPLMLFARTSKTCKDEMRCVCVFFLKEILFDLCRYTSCSRYQFSDFIRIN